MNPLIIPLIVISLLMAAFAVLCALQARKISEKEDEMIEIHNDIIDLIDSGNYGDELVSLRNKVFRSIL